MRILVIDDDRDFADGMAEMLAIFDHEVVAVYSCEKGVAAADKKSFDMALIDIGLGDQNGADCARNILKVGGSRDCVLVTGYSPTALKEMNISVGELVVLRKPVDPDQLLALLTG